MLRENKVDLLWSISVNQRMKANHNTPQPLQTENPVVVNISKSKNESKSQQAHIPRGDDHSCGQYQ